MYNASNRDFWGDLVPTPDNLVEDGFISSVINGTIKWLHVYKGDPSWSCCTNLVGNFRKV